MGRLRRLAEPPRRQRQDRRRHRGQAGSAYKSGKVKRAPAPIKACPWCGTAFTPAIVPLRAERGHADQPRDPLRQPELRLHRQSAAAGPDGRRGDLPAAAGLPDRHRRQVRSAALGRRERRLLRPCRPFDAGVGFFGAAEPGGAAARQRPRARSARPDHPGRAASDLGPARHRRRPLRNGDRSRWRTRHDRRKRRCGPRSSPRRRRCGAPRRRSRRCSTAIEPPCSRRPASTAATASSPDGAVSAKPGAPLCRASPRRARPEARLPAGADDAAAAAQPHTSANATWRRAHEPGRSLHDGALLLQRAARARRRAPHRRGRGARRASRATARSGAASIPPTSHSPTGDPRAAGADVARITDKVAEAQGAARSCVRSGDARRVDVALGDQHDLGRPRHHAARADGGAGAAEDGGGIHPGDEPRRPRPPSKPGLVVTLLNLHKPRDRTHFEQFAAIPRTFYRAVEATSVTPWAARALDRALAAVVVTIARHIDPALSEEFAAADWRNSPQTAARVLALIEDRAPANIPGGKAALHDYLDRLAKAWSMVADAQTISGESFQYGKYNSARALLHGVARPFDAEVFHRSIACSPPSARCATSSTTRF